MAKPTASWLLTFATLAVAGCTGGSSTDTGPALGAFDDGSGAIGGLVTNEEFMPLVGAELTIREIPDSYAITDSEGRFSFSFVPPGEVRVLAQQLGYEPIVVAVTVAAGEESEVRLVLKAIAVAVPYPELVTNNGIIRQGVGLIRTATCANCAVSDSNKETVTRFKKGRIPDDYAGIMVESKWSATDYIGIDVVDRTNNKLYWRIRSQSPIHFLLERNASYVGAPWYGRNPMPNDEANLSMDRTHIENWYIGGFQDLTHNADAVCQVPIGAGGVTVVGGYAAGCYGLGFVMELRFTNYLTAFHLALPEDVKTYSAMPDG